MHKTPLICSSPPAPEEFQYLPEQLWTYVTYLGSYPSLSFKVTLSSPDTAATGKDRLAFCSIARVTVSGIHAVWCACMCVCKHVKKEILQHD